MGRRDVFECGCDDGPTSLGMDGVSVDLSPGRRWVLAVWLLVGLIGMVIQLRYTGRMMPARVKVKKSSP